MDSLLGQSFASVRPDERTIEGVAKSSAPVAAIESGESMLHMTWKDGFTSSKYVNIHVLLHLHCLSLRYCLVLISGYGM